MSEPSAKFDVGGATVWELDGVLLFAAGMQIDADGAPNCYHPPTAAHPLSGRPPGLDDLRNAGQPGNWWGVVTDTGVASGAPIVQGPLDPYPGFYVSQTSLCDRSRARIDPRRYVDSSTVPYIVLPGREFRDRAELGDMAMVFFRDISVAAIYADVGPSHKIGEGSIALATALDFYAGINAGRERRDVVYVVFPGSRAAPPWPLTLDQIHAAATARLEAWGGTARVRGLFPYLIGAQ
jgi:hypothetical protein